MAFGPDPRRPPPAPEAESQPEILCPLRRAWDLLPRDRAPRRPRLERPNWRGTQCHWGRSRTTPRPLLGSWQRLCSPKDPPSSPGDSGGHHGRKGVSLGFSFLPGGVFSSTATVTLCWSPSHSSVPGSDNHPYTRRTRETASALSRADTAPSAPRAAKGSARAHRAGDTLEFPGFGQGGVSEEYMGEYRILTPRAAHIASGSPLSSSSSSSLSSLWSRALCLCKVSKLSGIVGLRRRRLAPGTREAGRGWERSREHLPPGVTGAGGGATGQGPPSLTGRGASRARRARPPPLRRTALPFLRPAPAPGAPRPRRPSRRPRLGFPLAGASCEPNIALPSHVDRSGLGRGRAGEMLEAAVAGRGPSAGRRGAPRGRLRDSPQRAAAAPWRG